MSRRVDQWAPALHSGDAIGDSTLLLRDALRSWGFVSDIYAFNQDPGVSAIAFDQWREGGHKAKLSTKAAAGPVTLAYAECLHVFQQTRLWEEEFDARLRDHAVLTVTYEDLARNFTYEMERVQSYLGVDQQSLQPATTKQAKKPLAERIANYVKLKQQFANTCWAEFFEA